MNQCSVPFCYQQHLCVSLVSPQRHIVTLHLQRGVTPLMLLPRSLLLSRPITAPQTAHVCRVPNSRCWKLPPLSPFNLASRSLFTMTSSALVPANRALALFDSVSCNLDRSLLCGGHLNASGGFLGPAWPCRTHGRENSNINCKFCRKSCVRLFDLVRNKVQRGPDPCTRPENH